ncbi:uncharacterized protein I303_108664 [Kwoniella dejecticola CBS 10117]|uniref:RING-type E3 ubiquitin transferase n=1 Tax=Kwoniella dejecticola CBS 10117 TaxID=1296121 RepID=A0A1A5ZWR7_9TREE|nr:uncharacterized protein I303_07011 [Kwoniella dejecticola CBS 10117]OBR82252.1 hypothetical protein I303_07011 [Kwoniella dejecticola CBS 10117]
MLSLFRTTHLWVLLIHTLLISALVIPPSDSINTQPSVNGSEQRWSEYHTLEFDLGQVPLTLPRAGSGTGEGQGWLSRWLSMGGEGEVVVHLPPSSANRNLTLPHRPAAFPSPQQMQNNLPLSGFLTPFEKLPHLPETSPNQNPQYACLPSHSLPRPPQPPGKGESNRIVLVERGGCDFATKVRAAQDRGVHAVIVGDTISHRGESDQEGRKREGLITMFSPEDTETIFIPSVFVSRASYLALKDLLANHTSSGMQEREGLWVDLSQGSDESGALTSLLSFALLMPSLFLLATIAVHRIRVARQREKDRAPPMIVLSLPERIWTPDIVWEKDDSSADQSLHSHPSRSPSPKSSIAIPQPQPQSQLHQLDNDNSAVGSSSTPTPTPASVLQHQSVSAHAQPQPPPPISPSEVRTPPAISIDIPDPLSAPPNSSPVIAEGSNKRKQRVKRQYFSKDECAICMDSFSRGDVVRILPCGHVFHKEECDEWLMKWRKLCPTCRADVTLPAGVNAKGSTITPVSNPTETTTTAAGYTPLNQQGATYLNQETGEGEERPRSWTSLFRSARERLYGYGHGIGLGLGSGNRVQLSDNASQEEGERTPLMPRSPTMTGDGSRRGSTEA